MSPTSYQLLYPAMLEHKDKEISRICKIYFQKILPISQNSPYLFWKLTEYS